MKISLNNFPKELFGGIINLNKKGVRGGNEKIR
jgi:hypothetical protein